MPREIQLRLRRSPSFREGSRAFTERLEPRSYLSAAFTGPTYLGGVNGVTAIAAGDLNGDGLPDIAVCGFDPAVPTGAIVGVYLNRSGSFGTPTILPIAGTPGGIALGDFTGNGKSDVAVVDSSSNTLDAFLNDGRGDLSAGAGASLGGSGGDTAVAAGDFNADGKDDVAVADPAANEVVIAVSNGDGSFSVQGSISVPDPQQIVVADFNGDGRPDLAILSGQSSSVYVALNNGNGSFGAATPYGTGIATVSDIASADLNGDGRADLVAVGQTGSSAAAGTAAVLLNQGAGTFGSPVDLMVPPSPIDVLAGKFTGSQNVDIATINAAGELDVFPGARDGTFGADQSIFTNQVTASGGYAIAADLLGNGTPGIAFPAGAQGAFGVVLNGAPSAAASVVTPALSGALPRTQLVSGERIAAARQTLTLTASAAYSGSVTVDLQFSPTTRFGSANPTVATLTKKLNLKAGRSIRFIVAIPSAPAGLAGTYDLVAQLTDSTGAVSTAASAQTVSIVAPTIDLSGSFVTVPAAGRVGRKVTVTFNVANGGTVAVNGPLPVDVLASTSGMIDSSTVTIDDFTRRAVIQPGKSIRLQAVVTLPAAAGTYYPIVEIDPQNTLGDVNPANNTFASLRPILVS